MGTDQPILTAVDGDVSLNRGIGWFYEIKSIDGVSPAFALDSVSKPFVNRAEMSAWATISTATPDRVGDILIPRGIVLDDFEKNPVCLWNHGLDAAVPFAIGKARNPDGTLAIDVSDERVVGKTYFAQSNPFAVQIFHLIDEGIICATSVRESPIKQHKSMLNGVQHMIVEKWSIEEFSWTNLGINPDATAKCLSRNRIDGHPLHESIYKSLSSVCPKQSKPGIGFTESQMKTDDADDKKKDPKTTPADETPSTSASSGSAADAGGEPCDTDDPANHPFGKQLLDAAHSGLKSVSGMLAGGLTPKLEHQGVKSDLGDVNDQIKSLMGSLAGSHAKHYPSFKCAMKSDSDEEGGDDDSDSDMKSFLACVNVASMECNGISYKLKSILSKDKTLTPATRKSLELVTTHLESLLKRADSHKKSLAKPEVKTEVKTESVAKSADADETAQFTAMKAKLKSLNEAADKLANA